MSTFTIQATLIHPDHRERSVTADFLVDTGAIHSLLPAEIVERLGLTAEEDFEALLANDDLCCRADGMRSAAGRLIERPPTPAPPREGEGISTELQRGFLLDT